MTPTEKEVTWLMWLFPSVFKDEKLTQEYVEALKEEKEHET